MTEAEQVGTPLSARERELIPAREPEPTQQTGLMVLIERAVMNPDIDVAKLEKLLEIKERFEREEARKAYVAAMAQFKKNPPKIAKGKHVKFKTQTGGFTEYDHATLASVTNALGPALADVGISYEWETKQGEGGRITVTCILTHIAGHSTRTELSASPDQSGGKNAIQAVGSSVSYLQRYTLLSATGMATVDQDDDGRMSEATVGLGDEDGGEQASGPSKDILLVSLNACTSMPQLVRWYNELNKAAQKMIEPDFKAKRKELMTKKPGA